MQNFDYMTPTRLIFGRDAIAKLPEVMTQFGKKILLTYGGGSIKKIGLYQKVLEMLKGYDIVELPGIQPNPKYDPSVLDGVRLCKEHNVDVILSVGGGSVLDCSKAIAAGAKYDGDPWDLISYKVKAKAALPIVDILTLAATGSEYDCGGVISRTETNDKIGYIDPLLFPVVSILDPVYTFTVSKKQTAAGIADAMNHTIEQYFVEDSTLLNDGFCESMLRSLMTNGRKCLENPEDYTARAEMMLACTYGCNGILALGNSYSGWPCHGIEHALSAYYDITHGESSPRAGCAISSVKGPWTVSSNTASMSSASTRLFRSRRSPGRPSTPHTNSSRASTSRCTSARSASTKAGSTKWLTTSPSTRASTKPMPLSPNRTSRKFSWKVCRVKLNKLAGGNNSYYAHYSLIIRLLEAPHLTRCPAKSHVFS